MEYDETKGMAFLTELYRQTEGDADRQTGMQDVGSAIGMEKSDAGSLAEDLIMEGLVELKTLSGAIGITAKGLEQLQDRGVVNGGETSTSYALSGSAVLSAGDQDMVSEILGDIRVALNGVKKGYEDCEEAVIDIKTIEVQLLSARPKKAIILAVFASLKDVLEKLGLTSPAGILATILCRR